MADIRKRFGKRIAQLREERGWTQEELAGRSGISTRSISSIENGVYSITLDTAYKLTKGFGIPLAGLFEL